MAETAYRQMSVEDFFAWQESQEERYELVDGFPVKMMSGASEYHDKIVTNVLASLHAQLRGTGCRPTTADIAVRTRVRSIRRPDITVTCGDPRRNSYEAANPRMVVEVLSPSNVGVVWQRKLEEYRRREGLEYILLIDSRLPQATLLVRDSNTWMSSDADDLDAVIDCPAIGCRLVMRDIYEGLTFDDEG